MLIPYPRMPERPGGRRFWIGMTCFIVLVFVVLAVATVAPVAVALGGPDRPAGGALALMLAAPALCAVGAGVFGWILADGLRVAARDRAELRRLRREIAESRARSDRLRGR